MIHQLWGLVQSPPITNDHRTMQQRGQQNLCFRLSTTAQQLWDSVIEEEILGTGQTKSKLQRDGWRAVPVHVVVGD